MVRDYGPQPVMETSQVEACQATIDALELGPEDEALKAYCLGLAEVLDQRPGQATLWAEYRPALELLRIVGDSDADAGNAVLLDLVRTAVGNTENSGPEDSGPGGRGDREVVGAAVDAVA